MRAFCAAVVALLILISGAVAVVHGESSARASAKVATVDPPAPLVEQRLVSATIRWVNSTTWVVLDDAGHAPTGISAVSSMSDRVRVTFDFTAYRVGSCQVTPDEQFSAVQVRTGTSVGLTYMDVFFYMPSYGTTPVPPSLLSRANANVWVTCFMLVEVMGT